MEQRWALPHRCGPRLKPLSGMQSACHLQASTALFDIQTNTCQKSMSHLTELLEIGKALNLFLAPKNRGEEKQMWVFIPTICACVKYRFLCKAPRTSSTFQQMLKNNRPLKVLHWATYGSVGCCPPNCSRGGIASFEGCSQIEVSYGGFKQNPCPSFPPPTPCCFPYLPLPLSHIEMERLL